MRILQVELENFKSYQQATVSFSEGTNAICGPNGAGKSTILEAIGLALFGHASYTLSQFVREGEKVATVTVHIAGGDERTYQVVRKCGSYSQHYVYDPELDAKLTSGVGETTAWLYDFFGVDTSIDLSALFENAVGVPQGKLTAAFLESPSVREDIFNPLLRVDEYERVWQALLEPRRQLGDQITDREKEIAGLEATVEPLPRWQQKAADLQTRIAADQKRQSALEEELEQVVQQKEALEKVKRQLDKLERAVSEAETKAKTVFTQLAQAQEALQRAQQAQAVVTETTEAHRSYLAAQQTLASLEQARQERDRLKEDLQERREKLAGAKQELKGLRATLEEVATAEQKMAHLQPQVEVQEELERALAEARQASKQLADKEQRLEQERDRLADWESQLVSVQTGLQERADVEEEIASLRDKLRALRGERDAQTKRIAEVQAEVKQVAEQTESLAAVETAQCPLCEAPLTPEHRAELLERNEEHLEELGGTLDTAQSQQKEMEENLRQQESALNALEQRVKALPRPAEADNLAHQVEEQKKLVAQVEAEVAELADAPAEVEQLERKLAELGDPRAGYQRAAVTADRREQVEHNLASVEETITELEEGIGSLEDNLAAYKDLDEQMRREREALASHEAGYQRYLEHVREAEALEECQERMETLEEEQRAAQAERDRLAKERAQVAEAYDAELYAQTVASYDDLRDDLSTLGERLRQEQGQLEEAQAEIERLAEAQAALDRARAQVGELEALRSLLETMRQVLREAGPEVRRALVEVISLQAARLYAEIMGHHTERLRWAEDYEILLTAGGRERTFQQLSGGEQMAAALATRLALLKEVSGIDVAFFDEPTANLDERRRDNLAEQVMNVRGLSQLFVISHDDTFERNTDNVIRVVKKDGASRVEG